MKSIWMTSSKKQYPMIQEEKVCEICIVGGGISGILCAYHLQNKYRVILIEADEIAHGASGRNTGKISSQHGFSYQKILANHGKKKTRQYYQANQEAINQIHQIILQEDLDVLWEEKKSAIGCKSIDYTKAVADEMKAYDTCEIPYDVLREDDVEGIRYGASFDHQACFDPYAFVIQLADKINVEIYEHSVFQDIQDNFIVCNGHKIYFKEIIFATQVMPFRFPAMYLITTPYQSYLAALKPTHKKNMMTLIEDEVILTFNSFPKFEIKGGYEHHIDENKEAYWQDMERMLGKENIQCMWSSQDYQSSDYLPIVGRINHWFMMSGYNKWGNTNAYVASRLICDLIEGKENELRELFDPTRLSLYLNVKFFQENTHTMKALLESKLQTMKFEIPSMNEGISVMIQKHPYGIYNDGNYHIVDLICPHLGCTLQFNEVAKSWDCPCHGSSFDIKGMPLKGPARQCLRATTLSAHEMSEGKKHVSMK